MEITLVSPQQTLAPGEQVTFEIHGLGQWPAGGTYIVLWSVDPAGNLTPASETIFMVGAKIYSVFSGAQPDAARASFDVMAANAAVTVTAEVRYSAAAVSPGNADSSFAAADAVASVIATVPGAVASASGAPFLGAPTASSVASDVPGASSVPSAPGAASPAVPASGGAGAGTPGGTGGAAAAGGQVPAPQDVTPQPVAVTMHRAGIERTASQALWTMIRQSTNALSFGNYRVFMDQVLFGGMAQAGNFPPPAQLSLTQPPGGQVPWRLPFPGVEPYRQLKAATEVFVMLNCGVPFDQFMTSQGGISFLSPSQQWRPWSQDQVNGELWDESRRYNRHVTATDIHDAWNHLLARGSAAERDLPTPIPTILYLALVRANLPDVRVRPGNPNLDLSPQANLELDQGAAHYMAILQQKLTNPCFIELLWSYWLEEAGLVQTMNAITWRFQNRRGPGERDPLASLEIDPLRPLNNYLWGYIQDEEHRLTVVRRAYEYAHSYGLTLLGKAVPEVIPADSRPRFIESLHNLLHLCSVFYKEDDDTTVVADGFPLLNALKEVHLLLTQGAGNQYGDLPWNARLEMLMQQWLLARPEFREFLPRRVTVDYPEEWMHSVESMKTLQGWSSASVLHFRDLAKFGEQIILSIRYEAWPSLIDAQDAANWARYWRPEIQGYIYAYRAVTGVDVTERPDATAPALLLRERMRESLPPTGRGILERPQPVAQLPMASRLEEYRR